MIYLHEPTGEYPVSEGVIKQRHPQISFTDIFAPPDGEGYALVQETPRPESNPDTENLEEDVPENVDGRWVQKWKIVPLTDGEIATRLQVKRQGTTTPLFNGQAVLMLLGEMPAVQAVLDAPETPPLYKLAFDTIPIWRRLSPAILWMQEQRGWSDDYIDTLFAQANQIEI